MTTTKDQRALLIVSSLSKNYAGVWKLFYLATEKAAFATARLLLGGNYACIVARQGAHATKAEFLTALNDVAKDPGISVVDVFFHLHGLPGTFCFYDADVPAAKLRDDILELGLPERRLRLCYNTGCFGDSQNWRYMLAAGFVTTIGAKKVNATGASELPVFCAMWRRGRDVGQAVRRADNPVVRKAQDFVARLVLPSTRAKEVDSEKVVRGRADLTVSSAIGPQTGA